MPTVVPYIPENITVHLAAPEQAAANVTIPFPEYIKNVASSEIYPTWDDSALYANIYAQISFALNRVYTEYYRSRGYDFDITASTAVDQKYIQGRNIFSNIEVIVDNIFDDYIRRQGNLEPLFAQFCNGTTVTCDGLSQWGSQELAEQGYNSIEILRNYYGNDIELVLNARIQNISPSYPGSPLQNGDSGNDISVIQIMLNRISQNYPAIPKVYPVDGIFGSNTENSVRRFQEIFNLGVDGIVGRATWYKMVYLYVGVTRLSELESEGQRLFGSKEYPDAIQEGDSGEKVLLVQYYLAVVSAVNPQVPPIAVTGDFGEETKNAVMSFQTAYSLPVNGIVDEETWDILYRQYYGVNKEIFTDKEIFPITTVPFAGQTLYIGSRGEQVRTLQEYLNVINNAQNGTSPIGVTGNFGRQTVQAVMAYQRGFGYPVTGRVNKAVWDSIANTYKDVMSAETSRAEQYPGYVLKKGVTDFNKSDAANTNTY